MARVPILIVLATTAANALGAVEGRAPHVVPVRVYDIARLGAPVRVQALAQASRTLDGAGVDLRWIDCSPPSPPRECGVPPSRDLIVRIVAAARRSPAGSATAAPTALGEAYVDTHRQAGVLATIYLDRVRHLAASVPEDLATVLGHAIAHELGHLLLGSTVHAVGGLMRPVWSADEVARRSPVDWQFTPEDIAAIRRRRSPGAP